MRRERNSRAPIAALTAILVIAFGAGCGGGGHAAKPRPIEPGGANAPGSPEFGENVIRVPGVSASDVAGAAVLAAFPPGTSAPNGWVFAPPEDWRRVAVAAQFAAMPVNGALLPMGNGFLQAASADIITRLHPGGFPNGQGLEALLTVSGGEEVVSALQQQNVKLTQVTAPTADKLAADLVAYRGGWAGRYSNDIVIVSSDDAARDYSLPAAAWSAYSGDTLTFVTKDSIPATTRGLLVQRQKLRIDKPSIYVIAPKSIVSDSVVKQLAAYGPVTRVAGPTPIETAIKLAEFNDPKTHFGWRLKKGPANLSFLNINHPEDEIAAIDMAGGGPRAALLLIDSATSLPPSVSVYLSKLKGPQGNQGYVFGEPSSVSSPLFAQIDSLLAAPQGGSQPGGSSAAAQ
jgi:hypothetical protein